MPCQVEDHYFTPSHAISLSGPKPRKCPRLAEWVVVWMVTSFHEAHWWAEKWKFWVSWEPKTQAHFLSPNMWVSIKEREKEAQYSRKISPSWQDPTWIQPQNPSRTLLKIDNIALSGPLTKQVPSSRKLRERGQDFCRKTGKVSFENRTNPKVQPKRKTQYLYTPTVSMHTNTQQASGLQINPNGR